MVILLEIIQKQRAFLLVAMLGSLGFAVTLNVMNVDGFIAHRNIERAADGEKLDISYLVSLSDDAVPALADEFDSSALPPQIRDQVGVVLLHFADKQNDRSGSSWKSFHFSGNRANQILGGLGSRLEAYRGP
jgi:hypothetical protein